MWKKCLAFVLTTMLVLPAHVPTALYAAGTVNAVEEEMDIVSTEMLLEEQIDTEELELEKNIGLETQNAGENVGSEKPERKSDEADLSDSDTMIIEKETEILSAADSDMTVLNDKMESHSYNASNTENIMVDFAGGDGTKENPYQVATAEQLNAVRNNLEACYIQVNDIDMSSWGNWEPIAAGTESFKGAYDGGNYCIWNLSIEENANTISGGSSSYGLFARGGDRKVSAQIKNVKLCNLNISVEGTGAEYLYVGGVVGESKNTYISNCSVSGKITILEYGGITVGGIAGLAEVEKCTNKANLCIKKGRGSAICGGVIGEGSCINSENYGNIERSGSEDATCGGIMGQGSCINSKNYGNIEISAGRFLYTGGIVGNGSAEYCTNYANVEGHVTSPSMSSQTIGWYNCFVGGIEGVGSLAKYCTNYGDVAAYNDKYSSKYVNTQSSAGGIVGGQHKQVFGTRNQVINCINWGENIVAEGIPDVQFYYKTPRQVGRITGDSDYILNCYSVGATLTNGELPTENIGTDKKNGATIIESGTADLDAQTVINFGSDSASLNKAMSGESGSVIDAVLVLKSNVYTIDDLTIISSNSNVAEIDHIEKDTGAYVPSLDGSENIATVCIKFKDVGESDIMIFAPDGISKIVSVTSTEVIYDIRMYSYIPTMMIGKGRSVGAAVQLYKNGNIVKDGANFTIVSSNSNAVSVSNVRDELDGTFFDITGVDEGEAIITITENLSGAVYSTAVQVNSGILTYNAEAMPKYYDGKNECNGYIDGMYIDEFTVKSDSSGGMGGRDASAGISVSFNVYNTTSACGVVDVYDADGKLIKSELIKRFSDGYITSIKDTLISAYKLVEDYAEGNLLTYKQDSCSEWTHIEVEVPWGGHIEITNNPLYSETCAVYNYADFYTTSILLLEKSIKLKPSEIKEVSESTAENVVSRFIKSYTDSFSGTVPTDKINKIGEKFAEKIGMKASKKILKSGIQRELASLIDDGLEIFKECDINIEEIILNSAADVGVNIAEGALIKAMGVPGATLSAMFTIDEYLNYGAFVLDMLAPHTNNAMAIYFDNENGCLYDNGVSVKAENGIVKLSQDNYVLHSIILSNEMDLSGQAKESLDKISNQYIVRDIYLLKDGIMTQPSQNVQVTIPIPDEYDLYKCRLYWVQDDGKLVEISTKIVNRNFVFITDHFSNYAIVEGLEERLSITVNSVLLDKNSLVLKEGDNEKLIVTITPDNADNKTVTWSSDNTAVATVADGIVTAVKSGTANITVTTEDGNKTAVCAVTVICDHVLTKVGAVEATCETDGNIEYYSCIKCGRTYEDAEGKKEITNTKISALGHKTNDNWLIEEGEHWQICTVCSNIVNKKEHSYELVVDKPATEEETGVGHEECKCGATRNEGKELPKLDHTHTGIQHYAAVEATCIKTGSIEYWTCSSPKCAGRYYKDAACQIPVDNITVAINPNNHVEGGKWIYETGKRARICLCGAVLVDNTQLSGSTQSDGVNKALGTATSYDSKNIVAPKTDDTGITMLYVAIGLMAVTAVGGVVFYNRKRICR